MSHARRLTLLGLAVVVSGMGCGGTNERLTLNQWAEELCTRLGAFGSEMSATVKPYLDTAGTGFTRASVLEDVSKGRRTIVGLSADLKILRPTENDDIWREAQLLIDAIVGHLGQSVARLDRAERQLRQLSKEAGDTAFAERMVAAEGELATVAADVGLGNLANVVWNTTSGKLNDVFRSVAACEVGRLRLAR